MIVKKPSVPRPQRVAVYCRQSVTDATEEFGSLDAQREQIELYIQSQRAQGWVALPDVYSDSNASGGNVDRPAFQRMLADIRAKKIDVVAVYKIDRLSRSLLDFTQTLNLFEEFGVSFVSTTQQFNTGTSVGRLILNILATFAQFERETISERTRDKMAAARRHGRHTGGWPLLGYDTINKKLVVNEPEAERVREIFSLYLTARSVSALLAEITSRGWRGKVFTNAAGTQAGGGPFSVVTLRRMLQDRRYLGMQPSNGEWHPGEHEAILDAELFEAVQAKINKRSTRQRQRNGHLPSNALLAGIVKCAVCGSRMGAVTKVKDGRLFVYYVCAKLQKQGADACRGSRVSSGDLETGVMEQLRAQAEKPDATPLRAAIQQFVLVADALAPDEQATAMRSILAEVRVDVPRQIVKLTFQTVAAAVPQIA
ncbi:MAG: recombinase family protein [Planctomycetes bacterium]|nr:recombinase family protein [Planctomycetota bacterium]